jgi:RNA polymerase sigma factor (sigma-70 family)
MEMQEHPDDLERITRDESAFAEFVSRYEGAIRGFTAMWAPSRDEADDVAQEVFLAALHNIHTFDRSRDLKTWLLGIARNLTRRAWRRVVRLPHTGGDEALDQILERHALAAYEARQQNADRRRDALHKCINVLGEKEKALFKNYVVDELSSASLASRMNTTEGTIRATISRIRRQLRACIERRLHTEGIL